MTATLLNIGDDLPRRRIAVSLTLVLVVVLAGCTTTYEADIASDGTIEELSIEVEMGEQLYQTAESQAQSQGYDSVGEFLFEGEGDDQFNESDWDSVDISDDGESTVGITASGGSDEGAEPVDITVDEDAGEITYVDTEGINTTMGGASGQFGELEWTYTVNMPGEVIETNGNDEGSGTVTWSSDEHADVEELRVTSEQTGVEGDGGDGLGPGLGVTTGIVAVLLLFGFGLLGRSGT
jgi:hypothetical protein